MVQALWGFGTGMLGTMTPIGDCLGEIGGLRCPDCGLCVVSVRVMSCGARISRGVALGLPGGHLMSSTQGVRASCVSRRSFTSDPRVDVAHEPVVVWLNVERLGVRGWKVSFSGLIPWFAFLDSGFSRPSFWSSLQDWGLRR